MKAAGKHSIRIALILLMLALLPCTASAATPLAAHGKLSVKGTKIVDSRGKTFQIKGVSTHGLSWFPEYVSKASFKSLRDQWGANTVRLAMYTAEYNGYCTGGSQNRKNLKKTIDTGVKAATDLGMYVIIDWHILSDNNPKKYQKQAVSFFKEMAKKYKNHNNVIYEICNEPNGGTTWKQIKSYAKKVIKTIRKYDKDAIILVGTPNWSQDVDVASKSPIKGYKNIMYTLHFYANTHRETYRAKLEEAVKNGLPVLVSEFSICDASGNGSINKSQAKKWMKLLNKYKIGYVAWNLSNKGETSSLIKHGCNKKSGWSYSNLTKTGKWLVQTFGGKLKSSKSSKKTSSKATASKTSSSQKTSSGKTASGTAASGKTVKSAGTIKKASAKYCRPTVTKVSSWKSGSRYITQYRLTIANKSKKTISNWKVRVNFKYAVKKSSAWNGKYSFKSKYVIISPLDWNKKISPKGRVSEIGFIVSSAKSSKVTSVKFG